MPDGRGLLGAMIVLGLVVAGCGNGGSRDSGDAPYCRAAKALEEGAPDLDVEDPDDVEEVEDEYRDYLRTDRIQSLLDEARRTAPQEIATELDILFDTYDEFIAGDIDLLEVYEQVGVEVIDRVNEYNRSECGIRSD